MKRLIAIIGTAAALTAGAAFAQVIDLTDSLAVVEEAVTAEFNRLGLDHDTDELTMRQIAEINLVFSDADLSDAERVEQIERIIETN